MTDKTEQEIMQNWNSENEPKVSICCITYNHEPYIRDALNGFLMQETDFSFEVLVDDDCSKDHTQDIIREYQQKYPNIIKPLLRDKNVGSMINFSENIKRANGKYIAFCEGDDYWTDPLKIQKQVNFLEANIEFDVVYTDINFYYQETNTYKKNIFKHDKTHETMNFKEHLINKRYLAPPTWLFKKSILNLTDVKFHTDGSFVMMLDFLYSYSVYFMNEATAVYRISQGSASRPNKPSAKYQYQKGVFQIQYDYLVRYKLDEETKKEILMNAYISLYPLALRCKDYDFISEIEQYMSSQYIPIKHIKKYVHRYNQIQIVLDWIKKYSIARFLKKLYMKYFN